MKVNPRFTKLDFELIEKAFKIIEYVASGGLAAPVVDIRQKVEDCIKLFAKNETATLIFHNPRLRGQSIIAGFLASFQEREK